MPSQHLTAETRELLEPVSPDATLLETLMDAPSPTVPWLQPVTPKPTKIPLSWWLFAVISGLIFSGLLLSVWAQRQPRRIPQATPIIPPPSVPKLEEVRY